MACYWSTSYIFVALEINKYIVYKYMYTSRNLYIVHIQYIYTLKVRNSVSGKVMHYIE